MIKILFLMILQFGMLSGASITYELSGGRFGDNLLAYLHGKWLAFIYQLPLSYKTFPYSDQLQLHHIETQQNNIGPVHRLEKNNLSINPTSNVTYVVPYFSEFQSEHIMPVNKNWIYYCVDWANEQFVDEICKLIKPINTNIDDFQIPEGCISIAIHIRKHEFGGMLSDMGDAIIEDPNKYADFGWLLKLPPMSFYADQLNFLANIFKSNQLYVFLFTDDVPEKILQYFIKRFQNFKNITFDYRRVSVIGSNNYVLEDFFAMRKFNCLIRSQSNYSLVAGKIANYWIEISPISGRWEKINNRWKPMIEKIEINLGKTLKFEINT